MYKQEEKQRYTSSLSRIDNYAWRHMFTNHVNLLQKTQRRECLLLCGNFIIESNYKMRSGCWIYVQDPLTLCMPRTYIRPRCALLLAKLFSFCRPRTYIYVLRVRNNGRTKDKNRPKLRMSCQNYEQIKFWTDNDQSRTIWVIWETVTKITFYNIFHLLSKSHNQSIENKPNFNSHNSTINYSVLISVAVECTQTLS